jgi:hypothetical protein
VHLRRTSSATALALLAGVLGVLGLPATAAHADTTVTLPITHYADMVVADGHVFISGGSGSTSLLVTDLNGTTVTDLDAEAGADGLAVSLDGNTVYAALPDAHAVTAINASTLTETGRYPVGDNTSPEDVAFAGGRIWFSYGSGGQGGGDSIGSVDTGTTPATVSLKQTGDSWFSVPVLTASPSNPNLLAAADSDSVPPYISVYDASGASLSTTARSWMMQSGAVGDMAFTPDGSGLITSGGPQYVQAYRTSDLTDAWSYQTGAFPDAVAVAPDGTVATGLQNANVDNAVAVYPAGTPSDGSTPAPVASYDYHQNTVVNAGLAWSPDSRTLFAVTTDVYGTTFSLHVLPDPTRAPDTLTLAVDNITDVGHPVSLTGSLSADQAIPAGATLHLTRTGPGTTSTVTTTLPDVTTTGPDGAFSTTDTPTTEGNYLYRVSYDGDAVHRAATVTATAQVIRADSTATFNAAPNAVRGKALTIPGQLAGGPYPSGTTVRISRTDAASPKGSAPWSAAVTSDGSFSVKDTPQVGGTVTYTVAYPGDAAHNTSTTAVTVQVSRAASAVTVAANASSYAYGATATVTAHLGTTYNGHSVSIYAQPYGGAKVLLKTGTVNSKGNLTATYKLSRRTTFSASFPGDYRYAPATASKAVTAHVRIGEVIGGYYTSTHVGSTLYRVYHHTAEPGVAAAVSPDKTGECMKFTLQQYYSGAWHTIFTVACAKLDSISATSGHLILKNATGKRFRIEAEYLPSASDHGNLATTSPWLYFTFRT